MIALVSEVTIWFIFLLSGGLFGYIAGARQIDELRALHSRALSMMERENDEAWGRCEIYQVQAYHAQQRLTEVTSSPEDIPETPRAETLKPV